MLKLYNKEHEAISALTNLKDYKIEYLLSGEDSLEFSLSICDEDIHLVEEEGYIRNKNNEYVIKAIDPSDNFKRFSCVVNIEDIKAKSIKSFDTSNNTIAETIRLAIAGTGWILSDNNITKRRTVRLKNTNALEVLREARKVFRVDFRFDVINKTIYVYEQFGEDRGVYFSDELNLRSLSIPSDTYDYATRIYPYGKDGLDIKSVNGGKEHIDNFQYSNKVIELIWEDNRYTDVNSLKSDAEAKLEELSKPKRSYQATISDLAKQNEEYSYLDFFIGDTITLLSKQEKFRDKQRIVKYIEYPNNPSQNTCELGNTTLTFEELQKENESKNQVVDNITSDNGTVDGSKVDNITTGQISNFEASVAKITDLTVINAKIENLTAQNVTITGKLTAVEGEFGTLKANVGIIDNLVVNHTATINELKTNKADITQLNAVSATIGSLEAEVGKIETLVNGNLSSENIQAGGITSDKLTIVNGFITNAMIANLDVSKVNAGDISTNKFKIKSDDGGIEIVGATQQFKDKNNRVRIQMGKDTGGNFNFILRGEDGSSTLIDHTGVKAKAIADDLIISDMISQDAVGEKQINYSSFATGFNKDSNTNTIKSTKIMLNNKNQTLDVAFNTLETNVNNIEIGGRNLLSNSDKTVGEDSTREFVAFADLAPIFDYHGLIEYTISFDIRSKDISKNSSIQVYMQNGSGAKYHFSRTVYVTTEFKRMSITVTPTLSDKNLTRSMLAFYGIYDTGNIPIVKNVKVEKGNKATDWTPAPEDIDSEINSIKEITTSQSTTIGVMQGQISTAINNTQIIKEGQTVLLKDDYSRTVQTVDSMKTTIGSHTSELSGLSSKVSTQGSSIEQLKNQISLKVEKTDITNAIDEKMSIKEQTKINGTELLPQGYKSNSDNGIIVINGYASPTYSNGEISVLGRCWITTGFIKIDRTYPIYWKLDRKMSSNNTVYFGVERYDKNKAVIENQENNATIYFYNATGTSDGIIDGFWQEASKITSYIKLRLLCDWNNTGTATTLIRSMSLKQLGSLIIEDSDQKIVNAKSEIKLTTDSISQNVSNLTKTVSTKADGSTVTDINNKVSSIENSLGSITSRVSSVESTTTTINGNVSSLQTRMSSAEQKITSNAIINTVSSTIDNKINDIKIGGRNYLTNNKRINNFRILVGSPTISTSQNECTNGVYLVGDNTHKSSVRLLDVINKNGLWTISFEMKGSQNTEVGFNLDICDIGKKKFTSTSDNTWKKFSHTVNVTNYSSNAYNFVDFADINLAYIYIRNIKIEEGNKATDWTPAPEDIDKSVKDAKDAANTANTNASSAQTQASTANNKLNDIANDNKFTASEKQNTKKEWDIIAGEKPKIEAEAVKFGINKDNYVSKYNTLNTYMNPLLSNLTTTSDIVGATFRSNFKNYYDSRQDLLNAISSKAKQLADTAQSKANAVDGRVTAQETRLQSAEQKITADAIVGVVKKSQTNGKNTFAQQSDITQLDSSWTAKFSSSGGYNLLKNSSGLGDTNHWVNGGVTSFDSFTDDLIKQQTSCKKALRLGSSKTTESYAWSHRFLLQSGKTYIVSGKYYVGSNSKGIDIYLCTSNTLNTEGNVSVTSYDTPHYVITDGAYSNGKYKTFSKTITVGSSVKSATLRLDNNGTSNGTTYVYVADLQIQEGEVSSAWTPHPNEVYDGVTQIDKDGVTVTASNVKSKTSMSANGFKITKTDTNEDVFKVNSSGRLILDGEFTTHNGARKSGYFGSDQIKFYNWWSDSNEEIARFYGGKSSTNQRSAAILGLDTFSMAVGTISNGSKVLEGSKNEFSIFKDTNFNDWKIKNVRGINQDETSKDLWINKIYMRHNQINSAFDSGRLYLNYWRGGDSTTTEVRVNAGQNDGSWGRLSCGDFKAYGTKNACVQTDIGYVDINAYETADYYFGDIGETILDNEGYSYVYLDSIFKQTVNTNRKYQVFLSIYGEGSANVIERNPNYFVVKGTPNIELGYEIKAKRKGYEDYRLERDVNSFVKGKEHGLDLDYEQEKSDFNTALYNEIEENLNLENKELLLVIDKNLERAVENQELINIVEEGININEDIN